MAKKKTEAQAPAISMIPLPSQDSPLVIDLPDGQKLVVGNIAQGTVIEVATWRGTGRPDSRTNRLMLGVSSTEEATQPKGERVSAPESEVKKSKNRILMLIMNFFQSLFVSKKKDPAIDELDVFIAEKERESLATLKDNLKSNDNEAPKAKINRRASVIEESEDLKSWLDDLMSSTTKEFERQSEDINVPAKGKVRRVTEKKRSSVSSGKKGVREGKRVGKKRSGLSSGANKGKKKSSSKRSNTKKRR